jgi:electron transfer flavoprotein alpha subunit
MAVLVVIETDQAGVRSSSIESVTLANQIAGENSLELIGLLLGSGDPSSIGGYNFSSVSRIQKDDVSDADLLQGIEQLGEAQFIILPSSGRNDSVAARLGVRSTADVLTSIVGIKSNSPFIARKGVFTGKAFADFELRSDKKVLTTKKNAFGGEVKNGAVDITEITLNEIDGKIQVISEEKKTGGILLPEADFVVSAGRGLKGPDNWGMIEELADLVGAATACSKPVSDVGWRPHHEHVGQTGIKVSPNLYIAIGISGAIQHLAGVSSSKVIVVINTDEDAPFFKAADYGVVGDAFQVVPKLIEVLKNQ